jgi:DNA polymerase III epsilon subunit-like protein
MFNPFNFNKKNPFKDLDLNKICYFDVEATGLHPSNSQITEIAAIIGDEVFYRKIFLLQETSNQIKEQHISFERKTKRDKTIEELLEMSSYQSTAPDSTEEEALRDFVEFCKNANVLLAHNASFDMKMINVRSKKYNLPSIPKLPVYDSLAFSRRFFIPALITLEITSKYEATRNRAKQLLDQITTQYYKSGQRMKITSKLSSLISALRGKSENWHQAMADAEMLKDLVENFFKLLFDRHYEQIIHRPTFRKYCMRNTRFEHRMIANDKKKSKN